MLILSAVLPAIVVLFFIISRDKNRKPTMLSVICYYAGVLLPALLYFSGVLTGTDKSISNSPLLFAFFFSFIYSAIPEELYKYSIFFLLVWRSKEFNKKYDGIIYAVFISLGMASVENIMYVTRDGYGSAFSRAVFSVPGHGLFAVLMGYYFSLAKFNHWKHKGYFLLKAFLIPVLVHGIYNFILYYMKTNQVSPYLTVALAAIFLIFFFLLWKQALKKIKLLTAEPIPEIIH